MKAENLGVDFFNNLVDIVTAEDAKHVVWLGMHPWCSLAYSVLLEMGLESFEVVDNNIFVQGTPIIPYKDYATQDDSRIVYVKSMDEIKKRDNMAFLMANTHFEELLSQLIKYGFRGYKLYNLYEYTTGYGEYQKRRTELCKSMQPLRGRNLQLLLFEILKEFKQLCDENNLRYSLYSGSMIGAVRHRGFVPWDDDVDVFMPLEDYQKLLKIHYSNGIHKMVDWKTENSFYQPFARLVDTRTVIYEYYFDLGDYRTNVGIDILPIRGFPDDIQEANKLKYENVRLRNEWFFYYIARNIKGLNIVDPRNKIEDEIYRFSFDKNRNVGTVNLVPWIAPKSHGYDEYIELEFEKEKFKVIAGYDEHLKLLYGENYMELPLVGQRRIHMYPAFIEK